MATSPTNAPDDRQPTNAPDAGAPTNAPQTRGQNPDNATQGAGHAEGVTTTPDNDTSRGGYGGSAQGPYDNRDGTPKPAGGGQSDPAPSDDHRKPGGDTGYTNADAQQGSDAQGIGSRGGSYNDAQSNSSPSPEAGRQATDKDSSTGAASGLINTGPDQQLAERQADQRQADPGPDSAGASAGRTAV